MPFRDDDTAPLDEAEWPDPPEDDSDELEQCPSCRKEIYADAERCPYCGCYISADDVQRPSRPWWIVLAAVILLIIILLFWI